MYQFLFDEHFQLGLGCLFGFNAPVYATSIIFSGAKSSLYHSDTFFNPYSTYCWSYLNQHISCATGICFVHISRYLLFGSPFKNRSFKFIITQKHFKASQSTWYTYIISMCTSRFGQYFCGTKLGNCNARMARWVICLWSAKNSPNLTRLRKTSPVTRWVGDVPVYVNNSCYWRGENTLSIFHSIALGEPILESPPTV